MKKIFTKLMLWAVAATALVSCENNLNDENPALDLMQEVTLTADKTTAEEAVRTQLIEGVPYWSAGDAVGVYLEDPTKHYKFENKAEEASLTATFTGQTAVANTLYVYYPYTANGVADKGAKVDIPANQKPTATSFDGAADIMLAQPVTLDAEGNQISDLRFARLGAIVKVLLNDTTGNLTGQNLSALTMTAASNLVGRVYIDVKNQTINEEEGLYYNGSKSVNAIYDEPIAANNPVYFVVYPQTLAAGSKLTIEAATESYAISKEIALPKDIVLAMSELMQAMRHTEVVKASVKFQGVRSGNGIVALKPSRKEHGPGVPQKKVSVQEMIDEIREKFQITDEEALFIREVTEQKLQDPDVKDAVARNRDDDEYLFGPYRQQVHVQISDIYQESGHYEEIADDKYSGNGGIFDSMATVVIQTIRAA